MMDMSSTPNDVRMFPLPPPTSQQQRVANSPSCTSRSIPIRSSKFLSESEFQVQQEEARAEVRDQAMFQRIYHSPKTSRHTHHRCTNSAPQQPESLMDHAMKGFQSMGDLLPPPPPPPPLAVSSFSMIPSATCGEEEPSSLEEEGIFELEM